MRTLAEPTSSSWFVAHGMADYMRAVDWIDGAVVDIDSLGELAQSRALFNRAALTSDEVAAVDKTLANLPRIYRVA